MKIMPRMKDTNSKRRFQLKMNDKLIAYNRALGLFGGIDGKGTKADKPLDWFINWYNVELDKQARAKGQEPGTFVLVNSDERGLSDANGKQGRTGKEEIAAEYHSMSKYVNDHIRIVNGKLAEGSMVAGKFQLLNKYGKLVPIPADWTVKEFGLAKMDGIESGTIRASNIGNLGLDVDESTLNDLLESVDEVSDLEAALTPGE
jgi:hypothetical protein